MMKTKSIQTMQLLVTRTHTKSLNLYLRMQQCPLETTPAVYDTIKLMSSKLIQPNRRTELRDNVIKLRDEPDEQEKERDTAYEDFDQDLQVPLHKLFLSSPSSYPLL